MKGKTFNRKLVVITIVYWFLLLYVIAALVWWFISLQKQNHQTTRFKLQELAVNDASYSRKYKKIYEEQGRKTTQYVLEGITFLAFYLNIGSIHLQGNAAAVQAI